MKLNIIKASENIIDDISIFSIYQHIISPYKTNIIIILKNKIKILVSFYEIYHGYTYKVSILETDIEKFHNISLDAKSLNEAIEIAIDYIKNGITEAWMPFN